VDTPENRRKFPDGFVWSCCDGDTEDYGCERGVHVMNSGKRVREPVVNMGMVLYLADMSFLLFTFDTDRALAKEVRRWSSLHWSRCLPEIQEL
jgi:hypothetical protein